MWYFSADFVFPIDGPPIPQGVVVLAEDGRIVSLGRRGDADFGALPKTLLQTQAHNSQPNSSHPPENVLNILPPGQILIPGFVNTHCHLELSHLVGKVPTGTTLLPFLRGVVSMREVPPTQIEAAIRAQDAYMWQQGIQAVGDISNKLDTAATKQQSPIRYYSFVEMFDFLQAERAESVFANYQPVFDGQSRAEGDAVSAVPHAPYTVSDTLYAQIRQLNQGRGTVSIHNQETPAEDQLFYQGNGPFLPFFEGFGASLAHFTAPGYSSLRYALERMDAQCRTLLVHNTMTQPADIAFAQQWAQNGLYWATCPNANLYIENRLPRYQYFLEAGAKMTIGTDSLTSNWQLSVLEELKTISRYQSYVPFAALLQWATLNGAEALQFDDSLGSLQPGKKPGLLALGGLDGQQPANFRLTANSQVLRLI